MKRFLVLGGVPVGLVFYFFSNTSFGDSYAHKVLEFRGVPGVGYQRLGRVVANACDLDMDGVNELAFKVANPQMSEKTTASEFGTVRVVSGATGALRFEVHGTPNRTNFGKAIKCVGDLSEDSIPDLLIGSGPDYSGSEKGKVTLVSGFDGEVVWEITEPTLPWYPPVLIVTSFGETIASIDDITGDGFRDFVVGADRVIESSGSMLSYSGAIHVYDGMNPSGQPLTTITGKNQYENFGVSVIALGDSNYDGISDFAASASNPINPFLALWGLAPLNPYVLIISGATLMPIKEISVSDYFGLFGQTLANIGDVDHDQKADFAVGSPMHDTGDGKIDLYGSFGKHLAEIAPRQVWGEEHPSIQFEDSHFGFSIASLDYPGIDLNGDGVADPFWDYDGDQEGDLIVGAPAYREFSYDPEAAPKPVGTLLVLKAPASEDFGTQDFDQFIFQGREWPWTPLAHFTANPNDKFGESIALMGRGTTPEMNVIATGTPRDSESGLSPAEGSVVTLNVGEPFSLVAGREKFSISEHEILENQQQIPFYIMAGEEHADRFFLLLGSTTGSVPGTPIPGSSLTLPLNNDSRYYDYLGFSLTNANGDTLENTFGVLDSQGRAIAFLNATGPIDPSEEGLVLTHAYLVFDENGSIVATSEAIDLELVE